MEFFSVKLCKNVFSSSTYSNNSDRLFTYIFDGCNVRRKQKNTTMHLVVRIKYGRKRFLWEQSISEDMSYEPIE